MKQPAKPAPIPTIAMVRRDQPTVGTQEWMDRIARKHGTTSPLRLEHRRKGISVYLGLMEETLKQNQLAKKSYAGMAEKMEAELTERLVEVNEFLKKTPADAALIAEKVALERHQKQLINGYRLQMNAFDMGAGSLTGQIALVEGIALIFDALTLRFTGTGKRSKKQGDYRISAALMLDGICTMMDGLMDAMTNEEEGDEGEDETPGEVDDDEIVTEEDQKNIEAEKKAKLKEN